jgi:hypothetical protein
MTSWSASYTIGRSTRRCAATQRPLATGEKFVAVLLEGTPENPSKPQRLDYAAEVWDAAPPQGRLFEAGRLIGAWRSTVAAPTSKPAPVLDDEALLDLFHQSEHQGPTRAALRMVLALLLIRHRALVHEGSKLGAMLVRPKGVPRPPQGPPLIAVSDPGLSDTAIADALAQLESLSDPDQPAQPTPAASPSEPTT